MRLLNLKNTGGKIHDSSFFASVDLYQETGLFIFLADAFLICHDKGYEFPEDLLADFAKHLKEFVDAEDKKEGIAALGFDNNKKGGAWQGDAARAKAKQAQILVLLNDFFVFSNKKTTKRKLFAIVAKIEGAAFGRVKNLYHESIKNKSKNRGVSFKDALKMLSPRPRGSRNS